MVYRRDLPLPRSNEPSKMRLWTRSKQVCSGTSSSSGDSQGPLRQPKGQTRWVPQFRSAYQRFVRYRKFEIRRVRLMIRRSYGSPHYYRKLMKQVHRLFAGKSTVLSAEPFHHLNNLFAHMQANHRNMAKFYTKVGHYHIWAKTLKELKDVVEEYENYEKDAKGMLVNPTARQCIKMIEQNRVQFNSSYDVYEDEFCCSAELP